MTTIHEFQVLFSTYCTCTVSVGKQQMYELQTSMSPKAPGENGERL